MATGSTYPVSRSTGVCAATGRPLQPGDAYMATLVERDGHAALERLDFSAEAWDAGGRPMPPLRLFGSWRGTYHPHEAKRQPLLSDAELLDLFEELGGSTEPKQIAFRYLLALLLVRRRVLRMIGSRRSGAGEMMLVVPRGSASDSAREPIEVVDPGMDDAAVADAIEQLGQVVATDEPMAGGGA